MSSTTRQWIARFAAPAAFLAAVTVAVLLVRAGLSSSETEETTTAVTTVATTATTTTERTTTARKPRARYYRIESGDTFATIAAEFDTTVEQLLALNPDVDPNALRVGQRIRVA